MQKASELWNLNCGLAKEQSLAFQAATKWKDLRKAQGRHRRGPSRPCDGSPQRCSRDNASEARRLAKKLLVNWPSGEDHASIALPYDGSSRNWQV